MEIKQTKPKSFSEILDHSFRIVKQNFSSLFLLVLILLGPLYLIQSIFMLASGTSFFRQTGEGTFLENFLQNAEGTGAPGTTGAPFPANIDNLGLIIAYAVIMPIIAMVLYILAQSSIILATKKIQNQESWTNGEVIKQAMSRFWPLLGSSLLFVLMVFGAFLVFVLVMTLVGGGMQGAPMAGAMVTIFIIILALFAGFAYLFTKMSVFFAAVTYEKVAPGIAKSWRLTKGRFWQTLGVYVVFYILISITGAIINMVMTLLLGSSVVASLVSYLVTIITTLIFFVGYSILYMDLKVRNEADDLKEMIDSYKTETTPEPPSHE
ncbi:MFS transporter [Pontibacillus marinus]|uniref:Glycerophosphoryl diester phosphodiesterase membrane domain-containing protein n=1 Tax=Pontibacillus marinus BH030004 = DSM 16465 TaxID=1385511 RepID=A0A0A5GHR5_9BACI|nr:hypothetical protein [Pontibacillus marinus]KGX90655.1 hypothetical protein N783_20055 [Pontibacillus marinus BH030004 = DSM 16465]